ncbi:MAG: DNA polymerase III subunit beta [Clostridiales bacterium]|jgi:DNA polymerase-3 subunit beta|nr:DNA polymerase III subunit beta [Clostridiales bacterium]
MRVICNGLDLADAVGKVIKAMSARSINPILECIKIKAEANTLTLTATDLELTIEKQINADVEIEGTLVVPGKFLNDYIKKMTDGQIEFSLSDRKLLTLRYLDAVGEIRCFNEDEFPQIKEVNNAESFKLQSCVLKDFINKIVFSVAVDEARPILKGCLFDVNGALGLITGVALDGYRLAKCTKPLISSTASSLTAVVPARSLIELHKLLDESETEVTVYKQRSGIMVSLGGTKVYTRLLDGDYLNYNQILPVEFSTEITLSRKHFEIALDRASLISRSDKNNLVKLDVRENYLTVSSESEIGKAEEKLSINMRGKEITLVFNVRYFIEALRVTDDEFLRIKFTRPESPCVITSAEENSEYLYLFLPIRVPG